MHAIINMRPAPGEGRPMSQRAERNQRALAESMRAQRRHNMMPPFKSHPPALAGALDKAPRHAPILVSRPSACR